MGAKRRKAKDKYAMSGGFGALPRRVWEHPDYQSLPGNAVKLLMDLACQYNGRNNGDLTAAYTVLKKRGWKSQDTITKAIQQLLDARLIVRTREGRFQNPGGRPHLYAISWKAIDECPGKQLDVGPTVKPPRTFSLEQIKNPSPETGDGSHQELVPQRARDKHGRYLSHQKPVRLVDSAGTRNW